MRGEAQGPTAEMARVGHDVQTRERWHLPPGRGWAMEENVRGRQGAVGRVGISAALAMVLLWGEGTEGIVTKGHCICCEMGLKHP